MIRIRDAQVSDAHFIISSWLKSYRRFESKIDGDVYFREHQEVIKAILLRSTVFVACNEEDDEQIFGYIVFEAYPENVVHYCFTKLTYRHLGIAKALIKAADLPDQFYFTHLTHSSYVLTPHKKPVFNPYKRYSL